MERPSVTPFTDSRKVSDVLHEAVNRGLNVHHCYDDQVKKTGALQLKGHFFEFCQIKVIETS